MHQQFDARGPCVGKQLAVMRLGAAEHLNHPGQQPLGPARMSTVAANQANALVGFKGKICMIQQSDVPKSELGVQKGNECHIESDYPGAGTISRFLWNLEEARSRP